MKARVFRLVFAMVTGVILAAALAYMQVPAQDSQGVVSTGPIGNNFEGLIDQNAKPVTPDTFAGKYQLVFFGFTHCPSICPTELVRLGVVLKNLSADEKEKLAPIFVSIDPARDTPAQLKTYLSAFDPAITGLTGPEDAVAAVRNHWKVYAARVQTEEMTDYTMDHSTYLYFRGPDGQLLDLFNHTDTPETVLEAVKTRL